MLVHLKTNFFQGICIYLKPEDGHKTICPYRAIKTFDDILVNLVGEASMQRFLICPKCTMEGKERYFSEVGPGFAIRDTMDQCGTMYLEQEASYAEHSIKATHPSMLLEKGSRKTLAAFLKDDIRNIEKKPFTELYPRLLEGDQVWIYRDADANAIARLMPYAHVVVYLGQNEKGQGEVVHVTNNERCCTPCRTGWCRTGTMKRAAIEDVIEENDEGKSQFQKH